MMSNRSFCECPRPVCNDCELPVRATVDSRSAMQTVKHELLHSGDLAAITDDQFERSINYTINAFEYLFSSTQEALQRKDSRNSVLSILFNEVDFDLEAMKFLVRVLKLQGENELLILRLQRYSRMLGEDDDDDDDENLTPCVQCSSPPKSPSEDVRFPFFPPPLQYVRNEYPPNVEMPPTEMRDEAQGTT